MSNSYSECADTEILKEEKIEEPPRFKVLMHNDDITTQDFVVAILQNIFHKNLEDALELMMKVHNTGIGNCGVFTAEIARAKVALVHKAARLAGYPLKCTIEIV